MSAPARLADVQKARRQFDEALRGMEQFLMNLDPGRVQVLRDWLRSADADGRPDSLSSPSLEGWPLAGQIDERLQAVVAARAAWRNSRRLLHKAEA